jgi:hypothetical protein
MWLRYFLDDFEIVPVATFIVGVTSVFTFHIHCIFVARSLYFKIICYYNYIIIIIPSFSLYDRILHAGYVVLLK